MLLTRRNLPLNALRAFEAAGKHRHMRRAADELGVTHGAISQQIKILEQTLQVKLLKRENNRLSLTTAGERLLKSVQEGFDRITEGALYLDPDSMSGEIIIAVTPSISMNWLLGTIGEFCQRYPEVEPRLLTIEPHQRKLPTEFDIALCLGQPETPLRQVTELYQEHYFPVCRPGLIKTDQPINKPVDLLQYPLLYERFNHWQHWFKLQGISNPKANGNIHLDYGFQSIEAARRGLGITLADQIEVAQDLQDGRLIKLLNEVLPVNESIYLVTDIETNQPLRVKLFVEELIQGINKIGTF